jgi:glycosyltransferase involved in cell wall biosynthesis
MNDTKPTGPVISIITPSYNQAEFLAETIESVLSQEGDFFLEYIIVDGGSTDNSVEIMQRYDDLLHRREWPIVCKGITFHWTSGNDNGQADAVNKGFAQAKGKILGWLNSDDTYRPGAVAKAVEFLSANPHSAMVYGNAWYTDRKGNITERYASERFSLKRLAEKCIICQPSVFVRTEALKETGGLDSNLHTCMDYDLWIRMGNRFEGRIAFIEDYLATSRMYGENKTASQRDHIYKETMAVVRKHYGYVPGVWIVQSILKALQTRDKAVIKILRSRLFVFGYLLQPATLISVFVYLLTRLTRKQTKC